MAREDGPFTLGFEPERVFVKSIETLLSTVEREPFRKGEEPILTAHIRPYSNVVFRFPMMVVEYEQDENGEFTRIVLERPSVPDPI